MHNFTHHTPTEIIFGRDTEEKVGEKVKKYGGKITLLVYGGGSVVRSGLLERVKTSLKKENIKFYEIGGVQPNPRLDLVEKGISIAINRNVDFILAVGGGSSIDTAKAIAHGNANPELRIWEDVWTGGIALEKTTPVGVVLTMSAAGSEMSDSAVITNQKTQRKTGLSTELNRPKFAILNPELTYTLPKFQLCCGIVDIMMHTMDRYFTSLQGNELTDQIAESVLRVTIKAGKSAVNDQTNYDAMSEIMWAGSISHNGLTGLGGRRDFATHKLGSELSAKYDVIHGASLSAVWGSWARYVYELDVNRFARYAKEVWNIERGNAKESAIGGIEATENYFNSLNMPISIGELEIGVLSDEELREMARLATSNDTMKLADFKKLDVKDVYEIYKKANH